MTDYLIVGSGLAGIAFAETALAAGMTIKVIDDNSQTSTNIAGGLYNPVILKRFSKLQNAQQQLDELRNFYSRLEHKLNCKVNFPLPVLRKFYSIEEQNNWFIAADKLGLNEFLATTLISKTYKGIDSPLGYGEVLQTGFVDTFKLRQLYKQYLYANDLFSDAAFDYHKMEFLESAISYKQKSFRHVVFAEGFGVHSNPYFNYLPLDGTKGELFIIDAPELNLDVIVNTSVFILPLGNNKFKVGATYNWEDKTNEITQSGKIELIEKIKEILQCDFIIIEHLAGIRPTVKDRRPLLGTHPQYKNLHILNGLGTRGVMLGPYLANILYNHIEKGIPLDRDNDIKRFEKKI